MKQPHVLAFMEQFKNVKACFGNSNSKISAVNADVPVEGFDIILLASDDMIPVTKGYDRIIKDRMKEYFSDTDGILWFNDGYKGDKLNTLCILGKKYYDRFGYIYHPDYVSCWADNEFTEVGNLLKKQVYLNAVIIKHEHPDYGFGSRDSIHQANVEYWDSDMNIFNQRKLNNFNL